ncbi:MAG: MBL fold metallo-hydrolase [Omnitrophica WOR_2 bacterium]
MKGLAKLIEPVLKDDALLADIARAAARTEQLNIWWLGQSGFLVYWQGSALLLDPYLSDSLTRKYAGTDKPHVRMTGRPIAPEQLDFIDIVTSSHNHTDHLDAETLLPLMIANPGLTILVSEANREFAAARLQVPPARLTGITCDRAIQIDPYIFHAIPSAHEQLEKDENGNYKHIGLIVRAGPYTLYHSGDALPYEGLADRLRKWTIDLALLPINGRDPRRGVAGNFSGPEAVRLARESGIRMVIPCHYEMFEFNTVSPEAFIQAAQTAGQPYHILRCGERFTLEN